jgi:glycine cleavage system H protein
MACAYFILSFNHLPGGRTMKVPQNLKYTKSDEWVLVEGTTATIGITDYAQSQLSDIVYVEILLGVGETGKAGKACASIESVKAAAEANLPVSGKVTEINEDLGSKPEVLNSDPFGEGWLVKLTVTNVAELAGLMDAKAYSDYCENRSH